MGKKSKSNNQLNLAAKASFWFLVCNIIQKGITAICTPVYTRIMDSGSYGEYTIYLSWFQIVSIIVTLNLSAGVVNNVLTEYYDKSNRIVSSFLGLSTLVSAFFLILYITFSDYWNSLLSMKGEYIVLMILQALFSGAYSIWATQERYDYKYKGIVLTCMISGVLGTVITVFIVIISHEKAKALIFSYAFIQILMGLFFYIKLIKKGRCIYSKESWIFALSFNLPLIPHYLSYILLNQSDRIMIDHFIGKSSAALYSVAYSISMLMMLVVTSINNTLIPYVYKTIKSGEFSSLKAFSKELFLLCSIGCFATMLLGPELIRVIASEEYYEALYIIPPVAASVYFMFCQSLVGTVAFYFKRTKFVMVATTCAALINIVLNYIFIPRFGYYAAGYTTLISYIILLLIHYYFYKKICKDDLNDEAVFPSESMWKYALIISVVTIFTSILYSYVYVRWIVIFLVVCIMIIKREIIFRLISYIKK